MSTFEDKLRKGAFGESIVDNYHRSKNWMPYRPAFDGPHLIDRFLLNTLTMELALHDTKTKPRREKYKDTGMDVRHYRKYLELMEKHKIRVFISFVDEKEKKIYGNWLDVLNEPHKGDWDYPSFWDGIVYFGLDKMITLAALTDEQCNELSAMRDSPFERSIKTNQNLFDPIDDIRKSVTIGFEAIRERKANGGERWTP